jgi:Ca-activated chloride channel family protein
MEVADMPSTIEVLAQLNRANLEPQKESIVYLMLKIGGKAGERYDRPGLNLGMVVDRSGSMDGSKMEYTRQALSFCIHHLDVRDVLSVVSFDNKVEVVMPPGPVLNKDLATNLVNRIDARGTTNLSGGLMTGHSLVASQQLAKKVNRIIMMTDGLANEGITDSEGLVNLAVKIAGSGQSLTCIGVGDDFNEDLLTGMAEAGRGNFYYVENPDQIPGIFAKELEGLLQVVAQNLLVSVSPSSGVQITRLWGYEPVVDKNGGLIIPLPDLYAAEEKALLVELSVPPLAEGTHTLLDVNCTGMDASTQEALEIPIRVDVYCTADQEITSQVNDEVTKKVELMKITDAREEAIRRADAGDSDGAFNVLNCKIRGINDSIYSSDELIAGEVAELKAIAESMKEYNTNVRKNMQYSNYQSRKNRKSPQS